MTPLRLAFLALAAWGAVAGLAAAWAYRRYARKVFEATGQAKSLFWVPLVIVLTGTLLGWLLGGAPTAMNVPFKGEFAVESGGSLTPEYLSLLLGLTVYTAAFVAEEIGRAHV
mgnify:CR=1 FL=1